MDEQRKVDAVKVSIVLPTFNESKNVPGLLARIGEALDTSEFRYECIFVDDSTDDTADTIRREMRKYRGVSLVKRRGKEARTGLTMAFRKGFERARGEYIVCIDTDLQHPPEKIPELLRALDATEADVVVASRYAAGGSAMGLENGYRRFVSKISTYVTWMMLPSTRATTDPMTGFFAFRRNVLEKVVFYSHGFKILVELLAGLRSPKVVDVPFVFKKRENEQSKASISQGIRFFKDMWRLFGKTSAGDPFLKYMTVATIAGALFFGIVVLDHIFLFPGSNLRAFILLFSLSIVSVPFVFLWAFSVYGYRLGDVKDIVVAVLWVGAVTWLAYIFSPVSEDIKSLLVRSFVYIAAWGAVLVVLYPLLTKNIARSRSLEWWVGILFVFLIGVTITDLVPLRYEALVVVYFVMIIQGFFALYVMVYIWDTRDEATAEENSGRLLESPSLAFSVIIPCKHEKTAIGDTLRAMDRIDYPDHLKQILVVVHEGTDDGTISVIKDTIVEIGKTNIELVTYDSEPVNKPHGLNEALKHATGEYVVIFDAEDEPNENLFKIVGSVIREKGYDVVQSGVQLINYDRNWYSVFNVLEYYFWFRSSLHFFAKQGVVPLGGVTVFFKRSWLHRVSGWDISCLTEDADIGIRLSQAGACVGVVYDPRYSTLEETPPSLWSMVKQRTRWAQGFLQILQQGNWKKFPTFKQRALAWYILAWPIVLSVVFLMFPAGLILMFFVKMPPALSVLANVPLFVFLIFLSVLVIGFYEFTRDYNKRFSLKRVFFIVVLFYPYTVVLAFSGMRALYRNMRKTTTWEKTEHLNLHRSRVSTEDTTTYS